MWREFLQALSGLTEHAHRSDPTKAMVTVIIMLAVAVFVSILSLSVALIMVLAR